MSKTLRPRHDSSAEVYTCAHSSPDEHEQDPPARHDSSAVVYTCAHTPRSPTFRLPSPTPSTRVCVRPPIIAPVLGLPHSRARLLSTYSSAEVYTCAHSSPDEHEQDPPATKTLSIQALRPRHDSSAEVYTCAHTPRSPTFRLPFPRLSFCPQTFLSAPCTHVYLYVFDKSSSESAANAWSELANLQGFLYGDYTHNHFAAFDLTSISGLKVHSGSSHDAVKPARKTLHRILSDLTERPDVKLAIVTIPSAHRHKGHQAHVKRHRPQSHLPSPMPRPAEIDSISTCYSSAETADIPPSASANVSANPFDDTHLPTPVLPPRPEPTDTDVMATTAAAAAAANAGSERSG
ncbi:hypothetical protein C8Q76DRAFT_790698 [Earliella scabrosa]|nr:hypothetical protein C8Q76DRAFT_790698 [Earliella scabrosa]